MRRGDVARGASQGVHVPQVHAFNVLRAAFADKDLSTETTAFAARGLEVAVRAFSSPHWEVSGPKRRRTTIVSDRFATRDRFPTDSSFFPHSRARRVSGSVFRVRVRVRVSVASPLGAPPDEARVGRARAERIVTRARTSRTRFGGRRSGGAVCASAISTGPALGRSDVSRTFLGMSERTGRRDVGLGAEAGFRSVPSTPRSNAAPARQVSTLRGRLFHLSRGWFFSPLLFSRVS